MESHKRRSNLVSHAMFLVFPYIVAYSRRCRHSRFISHAFQKWKLSVFSFLIACPAIFFLGCGTLTVKHVNPDNPNALESNERVVFGRIIFSAHSKEVGNVIFAPLRLGLVDVETQRRARRSVIYKKTALADEVSAYRGTHEVSEDTPWFESDGSFSWVLPTGSYQIDALAWGMWTKVSAEDLMTPKTRLTLSAEPDKAPECGFVINPNVTFNVSGEGGALYIGSLLIDLDIKTERGIEVGRINRVEIKDESAEATALLKSRCPSFILNVEKRLMTSIPNRQVSAVNRRCPTWAEIFLRAVVGAAVQFGPYFIPVGLPGAGPSISIPSINFGK
jgi:sporulation protein YlmC with PRC-barrel domain